MHVSYGNQSTNFLVSFSCACKDKNGWMRSERFFAWNKKLFVNSCSVILVASFLNSSPIVDIVAGAGGKLDSN